MSFASFFLFISIPRFRVESIVSVASLDVDLTSLKKSIRALQKSSIALDKERGKAKKDLRILVKKWRRHSRRRRIRKFVKKALCKVKKTFGRECSCPHKDLGGFKATPAAQHAGVDDQILGLLLHEGSNDLFTQSRLQFGHHHRPPLKQFKKLLKRIQTINKKSSAFERGFISKDGIKDREWYKHLAVAPGKWLGWF